MMHLSTTRHKQQGSGLILVVFIIVVVLGLVALTANRNQQRNSDQLLASVIGTRAEMAARSGAQIEISRYYQTTTGSCRSGSEQTLEFEGEGLAQCRAKVTCLDVGILDSGKRVYQLTSTGSCTVGDWVHQRVIEVGLSDDS